MAKVNIFSDQNTATTSTALVTTKGSLLAEGLYLDKKELEKKVDLFVKEKERHEILSVLSKILKKAEDGKRQKYSTMMANLVDAFEEMGRSFEGKVGGEEIKLVCDKFIKAGESTTTKGKRKRDEQPEGDDKEDKRGETKESQQKKGKMVTLRKDGKKNIQVSALVSGVTEEGKDKIQFIFDTGSTICTSLVVLWADEKGMLDCETATHYPFAPKLCFEPRGDKFILFAVSSLEGDKVAFTPVGGYELREVGILMWKRDHGQYKWVGSASYSKKKDSEGSFTDWYLEDKDCRAFIKLTTAAKSSSQEGRHIEYNRIVSRILNK